MEDINLHFTGDAHAVSASHNLGSAFVDNRLSRQCAQTGIAQNQMAGRTLGVSDRALRDIDPQCGGRDRGLGSFVITEASEIMAVLALATDHTDLRPTPQQNLCRFDGKRAMTTAEAFGCVGSIAVLLKDALLPNLVQTWKARRHSCMPDRSVTLPMAAALLSRINWAALREYVITEAGFGSDRHAEKILQHQMPHIRPTA